MKVEIKNKETGENEVLENVQSIRDYGTYYKIHKWESDNPNNYEKVSNYIIIRIRG